MWIFSHAFFMLGRKVEAVKSCLIPSNYSHPAQGIRLISVSEQKDAILALPNLVQMLRLLPRPLRLDHSQVGARCGP